MAENNNKIGRERPLSPHLQVYKPQFTSFLSILHRFSIVAMYFGVLGLVVALYHVAFGLECPKVEWLFRSENGQLLTKIVLSGYALAASYWVCATIRHLAWDAGYGFDIKTAYRTAIISVLATFVLAALIILRAEIWM
jgi:succinate dehydrogenase / fumarate reductase cytochrome b subunit